jgi:signal transduction histidine kinase
MMTMSLSSRIIIRLTITTLIAAASSYGWLYVKQSRVETYLRQRSLVRQAEELASYISLNADGAVDVNLPPKLSEAYNNPGSRYRYAVRDDGGRIVATSGRRVGPLPTLLQPDARHFYQYKADEESASILGAAARTEIGTRSFYTQVEQTSPMTRSLNAAVFNEFFMDGGWLQIPFLLALLGISALTLHRALAPVKQMASLAAKIDPGSSELRLPVEGTPSEILPLVTSFNKALDRLDEGLSRQREFNANAAHQLRTPLAVLAANIDTMRDSTTAAKLRHDVQLMSRIVHQLLLVSRLESLHVKLDEPVDLCLAARQVAENLGPVAVSTGKTLEVDEPNKPVLIRGNPMVVNIAISNLIENAINHTLPGSGVRIRVSPDSSIAVCDSGPGIPPEFREKVFQRFWRGDTSGEGAGLGLSIVRRIMHALKGSISVTDAPEGGAQFVLQFCAVSAIRES